MGNKQSQHGRLSQKDVERLQRRFQRMAGPSGLVSITSFQSMVELGANPFIGRMFQLFDSDNDGQLSSEEFTKALDYFGSLHQVEEQYKFAFKIYDVDADGFISGPELYQTLHQLMGQAYTEAQLEQVVLNTMNEFDADGDNRLDFEEFKQLLNAADLQNKLMVSF